MALAIRADQLDIIPKQQRARLSNKPFAAIDKSTARGRRTRDVAVRLLADIGNPDDMVAIEQCIALAELTVRAEEARRAYNPDHNALAVIVRLEGLIDRRRRKLIADYKPPPKPRSVPTLAELQAKREAQEAITS
jgi:hypothetical protein